MQQRINECITRKRTRVMFFKNLTVSGRHGVHNVNYILSIISYVRVFSAFFAIAVFLYRCFDVIVVVPRRLTQIPNVYTVRHSCVVFYVRITEVRRTRHSYYHWWYLCRELCSCWPLVIEKNYDHLLSATNDINFFY